MMQKLWQKKPKLNYSKDVLDIVQFGSSVIEGKEPNDIDIAVIYNKIPIKEQLLQSQKIKEQLEKFEDKPIHISSYDFYSLFDKSNFAKEGILLYGKSLIHGEDFSKRFSFDSRIQIYYYLEKLKKKDKVRFNYMLNGKGGEYGLLRKYNGKLVKPGLIEINPEYEDIFMKSVKEFNAEIKIKKVLIT
jgi:predicted nucleotidyltransferase